MEEARGQYPDIGRKQERCTCYLQNIKINMTVRKEEASLDCTEQQVFKLQMEYTYCIQCGEAPLDQIEHVNTLMGAKKPRDS